MYFKRNDILSELQAAPRIDVHNIHAFEAPVHAIVSEAAKYNLI